MKKLYILLCGATAALLMAACQGGKTAAADAEAGDTLEMKYAKLLTIVKHGDGEESSDAAEGIDYQYAEAIIANPWKAGTMLHRYILIPKGEEGDKTVAMLARRRSTGARCTTDTVRTPVESNLVFTAPHCQLLTELGCQNAITGVCDKDYINIPDIKSRAQADAKVAHPIMDCGSSMQPDIERIIALHPEALLISPFENSGGYGKLDKLRIPVIETADYMETSPLGRAEWIKLYGLLLGSSKADSLFSAIEKEYLQLKAEAAKLPLGLSILTERKTGNVWYVPGGKSTMGILLRDAHARYIFADDTHSGSLSMSPEQIIAKGNQVDVWAFKYFGGNALTKQDLLAEYQGYQALKAFQTGTVYETDTSCEPYFELTSFHPEILLREFIILSHPEAGDKFGKLRFYKKY
ncbi:MULTISPECIES: ABC transporter substrate-binding protein [Segatella]|jgi:iron complex transport system substrate-binding protein|uniref:ABC transporter substrate-binding protein n=2 Tax=Segatella copri TaxID=165179 RepID=A0AAW5I1J0_9BACT|nr:ABC transporter substrate-binding protein [Segatella copri]MCF0067812.1 ABC transporter substrate-binding protein [Segatella copri]MCP9459698.1 ABC transporter substrate-binding protein [Segatella copri]MCP9500409.1 ABC transporter substrate-binding protein [Segatella copri]MCP9503363.1 ABC transporter substrate-binding protein [Segatella copri]MCP9506321.1 ABC transporter substrate-binding protein [Segatella copri]